MKLSDWLLQCPNPDRSKVFPARDDGTRKRGEDRVNLTSAADRRCLEAEPD